MTGDNDRDPGSTLRIYTVLLIGWTALWLVLGVFCFLEVRSLSSLSDTLALTGDSLEQAGEALGAVASIPLVGSGLRPAAERVQTLAADTIRDAATSKSHIHRLSWLALVMGCLIPVGSGVALYFIARRSLLASARSSGAA